jgi:hypothetical protein
VPGQIKDTYFVNEPVYLSYEDLRTSFDVKSAQDIIQPGKLYFKDQLIFVNEYQKGIHVVNNADPANPQVIKFIELPEMWICQLKVTYFMPIVMSTWWRLT